MPEALGLLGIDVGLTAAKVALFDEAGRELYVASVQNPRSAVDPHRQEIDMVQLWSAVAAAVREVVEWSGFGGFEISGVGVTGHGNGLYLIDAGLQPVRPAIASNDTRGETIAAAISGDHRLAGQRVTGSIPWAGQPAVLLRWLAEHEPESVARARYVLSCKDWIVCCLTGVVSADYSDASASGLLNLAARRYEDAAFAAVGLPATLRSLLPPLSRSNDVVGVVSAPGVIATSIPQGTPVVAGCMDCVASPIGGGSTALDDVTVIVGTWAINAVVVPSTAAPPRVTLNSLLPEDGLMLAQEVAPTSATNLEWLAGVLSSVGSQRVSPIELIDLAASIAPGAGSLLFLPFIHGVPGEDDWAGRFLGLRAFHHAGHLARAVLEGVAQFHRIQLGRLQSGGVSLTERSWSLVGGGGRSAVWSQIFADVLGHRLHRRQESQPGARGAARLAGQGVGRDTGDWCSLDQRTLRFVEPGPDAALYREQATAFDDAVNALITTA